MKNKKINEKLIKNLEQIIESQQLAALLKKYKTHIKSKESCDTSQTLENQQISNSIPQKHRKVTFLSKQKHLLRRRQNQKELKQQIIQQHQENLEQKHPTFREQSAGRPIKDKAIFINLQQIPYLHSTDLLNHLYKKPSTLDQQENQHFPLYNPPANNPYVLTKVKYLSIYYCKIESLRDMGTGWSNLIQLSVYFGRLKDLSGLNAFPSLEYLNCPFNSISTISDLMFHSTLVSVDFESNLISDFSQVEHLFTIDNLQYINLSNNPVYQSKQNKRKIQQKFEKIIDSENNRFQEYVNEKRREIWELENIQGVEYCNNILKEFFTQSKNDQITVELKHQIMSKQSQNVDFDFQTFQANFGKNQKNLQKQQNEKIQLKIEYIPPEIPQNMCFEQMIMKGTTWDGQEGTFCEEKIYMTPLTNMINKNQIYIGPVLDKYLKNKLYIKDQTTKVNRGLNQSQKETKNESQMSKPKKISKLSMTAFSSKGFSSMRSSQASAMQANSQQNQKSKQFATTTSSFSTNCTNMNNTSTNFSLRRSRLNVSKSKENSVNKIVLTKNIGQNVNFHQVPAFDLNSIHKVSLGKQPRVMLGRSLKKQVKDLDQSLEKGNQKILERSYNDDHSSEKQSFLSTLKRKHLLHHTKKQKTSSLIKKEIQS